MLTRWKKIKINRWMSCVSECDYTWWNLYQLWRLERMYTQVDRGKIKVIECGRLAREIRAKMTGFMWEWER